MNFFKNIPFFAYLLIAYNIMALIHGAGMSAALESRVFSIPVVHGSCPIRAHDLFVILGISSLYGEIIKSTGTSPSSVVDHALSLVVFVIFLIEFITLQSMATPAFLILTLMALLDVIAGFSVTISAARRDLTMER